MTDGDFFFQDGRLLARARMQHAVVLHVRAIADADVEHVAADDRAKPDGCLFAYVNVADDLRAIGDESCLVDLRMNSAERTDHAEVSEPAAVATGSRI